MQMPTIKKIAISLLFVLALQIIAQFPIPMPFPFKNEQAAAEPIPTIPQTKYIPVASGGDPNKYYFVAMVSQDIWKGTAWRPYEKDSYVTAPIVFSYSFQLWGQKIIDVDVETFDPTKPHMIQIFNESRYEERFKNKNLNWGGFESSVSESYVSQRVTELIGEGTDTISFDLAVTGRLKAPMPEDISHLSTEIEGLEGLRYYFPTLLTITVQPQIIVRHWDADTGRSLDHIFSARQEDVNTTGTNTVNPPANTEQYTYVGYKQANEDAPNSSDTRNEGIYSFTFDNTFNKKYVYLYYREKKEQPDLIADDIVANGQIAVNKPASFTAKFRNTGAAVNQPYNVKIMNGASNVKIQTFPSAAGGEELTMDFTYTFTSTAQQTFRLIVDSGREIVESDEGNNEITRTFKPKAGDFDGTFTITPSTITYRDPFKLDPDIIMNGCAYQSHRYRFSGNGADHYTGPVTGMNSDTNFSFPYSLPLTVGNYSVYMEIKTSCGTSDWIGPKSLTITTDPDNRPPYFKLGWFHDGDNSSMTPVQQVVQGSRMMVRVINDPLSTPPSPSDPDGDPIQITSWDFSNNAFTQGLPGKYGFPSYAPYLNGIEMDTLGYHIIRATMTDVMGASYTAFAMIQVVPPNPIPLIDGPATVKEGRPIGTPWSSERSYSPAGRTIDHTKDEWTNKKNVYTTPGTEQITLHVTDSAGLRSLSPAVHHLTVTPDKPPIAKLEIVPLGIRGQTYYIYNKSYSEDDDTIASVEYRMRYDRNNNGFADDGWTTITGNMTRAAFTPAKVGKYQMVVRVCEDYGKCDDTLSDPLELTVIDITNLAPTVSFEIEGRNEQPDLTPEQIYTPATMYNWALTEVNSTAALPGKGIRWDAGTDLVGKQGKKMERVNGKYSQYQFWGSNNERAWFDALSDNGYGANGLSPYKPIAGTDPNRTANQPLLKPDMDGQGNITGWRTFSYSDLYGTPPFRYTTTPTHMYFNDRDGIFYALNKRKVGQYELKWDKYGSAYHELPNGSYYDYVIGMPHRNSGPGSYYAKIKGYNEPRSDWEILRYEDPRPYGYAFIWPDQLRHVFWTSDTLYQVVQYKGYAQRRSNGDTEYAYMNALISYDLRTGEQIGHSFDNSQTFASAPSYPMERNGNVVIITSANIEGTYRTVAQTIDRKARIVSNKVLAIPEDYTIPSTYSSDNDLICRGIGPSEGRMFEGIENDLYVYEMHDCRYRTGSQAYGQSKLYLTKYDAEFNVVWRKQLAGEFPYYSYGLHAYPPGRTEAMIVNPFKNEVYTKSYGQGSGFDWMEYIQVWNMTTGAQKTVNPDYRLSFEGANFQMDWSGNTYQKDSYIRHSVSPYGNLRTAPQVDGSVAVIDHNNNIRYPAFDIGGVMSAGGGYATTAWGINYAEYIGDGMMLALLNPIYYEVGRSMGAWVPWLAVGTPSDEPRTGSGMTLGQLLSPSSISNHEISFSLLMDDADADRELVGMSFRASNGRNRYAVEADGQRLYLSKYVNGTRTVLKQTNYPFQDDERVNIRIKALGNQLDVSVNGVPYLSAEDGSFASGKFGPFSNKLFVRFGPVKTKPVKAPDVRWDSDYAIWENGEARAEIKYKNITFEDPEDDPVSGSYQWKYTHTPKFISNQGLSALHDRIFSSHQLYFDKVGEYEVLLSAKDDPHPDYRSPSNVFSSYRQASNTFGKKIIVHRRPIADKSHTIASDGKVLWTDNSRDPDRYLNATTYSTEATGIDYRATKGILEKRFYYITPSGRYVAEKLVTPTEIGTYEVGMAVKDEYGAWSEYDIDDVMVGTLPPPNEPPIAGFTLSHTTTYRGVAVTINSTARDPEDGDRTKLPHTYYLRNTAGGNESLASTSRTSWTKTFSTLGIFEFRQVVSDSLGQEAQATRTITINNRKPTANITMPTSTNQNSPQKLTVLRPTFTWTYADQDGDTQQQYHVRIYRNGGTIQLDSGIRSGAVKAWTPSADLPENVTMYIEVRVYDGYDWSDWSSRRYFYIETNRPPIAQFRWLPDPVYEGDTVKLIDESIDPDGDPLSYQWQITDPAGRTAAYTSREPSFHARLPGRYDVRLTVSDGKLSAASSKIVTAAPLSVTGEVNHTAEWRERHLEAGHEVAANPKHFYAGERMRLRAMTPPAPARRVTAAVSMTTESGVKIVTEAELQLASPYVYEGSLHDERWAALDDSIREGVYPVIFRAEFNNGVVKEDVVPIRIIGNMYDAVSVHRVR